MTRARFARALHTISLGRITLVDDSSTIQKLQLQESVGTGSPVLSDGVLRVAEYGLTSSPPVGADAIMVRLWGNRTLTIAIGTNHQPSRPKGLQPGDVTIYSAHGQSIQFQSGRTVVDFGGLPFLFQNYPTGTLHGDLTVTGAIQAGADVVANSQTSPVSLATHLHPLQGPGAPETGAPLPE